jgi:XXXCH domain-containing protein
LSEEKKEKLKRVVSPEEAAALLRDLAEKLERGFFLMADSTFEIGSRLVFEQSLKLKPEKCSMKLKITASDAVSPTVSERSAGDLTAVRQGGGDSRSFKELKRNMKKSFKLIKSALESGVLPSIGLVEGFCSDGEEMTAWKRSLDDPSYQAFSDRTKDLVSAVERGSRDDASAVVVDLESMEKICHGRKRG